MPEPREGEFYVGYLPAAPARLAARTRRCAVLLVLLALLVAAASSGAHRRLPAATFEFGQLRSFTGVLLERPYPALLVSRPASTTISVYSLVAPGKHGAGELAYGLDGHRVELEGTLIHRDGQVMVEIAAGGVRDLGLASQAERASPQALGRMTLCGEIVDSKCFLGVMNPGSLKTHKECAVRCISGGIPPMLCVKDEAGRALNFLLVAKDGSAVNQAVLDLVAEPIEITGQVERLGDRLLLRSDPATYLRLP